MLLFICPQCHVVYVILVELIFIFYFILKVESLHIINTDFITDTVFPSWTFMVEQQAAVTNHKGAKSQKTWENEHFSHW